MSSAEIIRLVARFIPLLLSLSTAENLPRASGRVGAKLPVQDEMLL
jgi:hypothetical protein